MADLDDVQDPLLDSALASGKDDPDDSILSEIAVHDTSVDDGVEDPELEAIKARVKEMEEEAEKLKEMQKQVEKSIMSPPPATVPKTPEEKAEVDARSVYVGNVDYSATAEELEQHFHGCGSVNRVTILCDKFSGHPKGFAYVEFTEKESVDNSLLLSESLFKGRQIKVSAKRTNRPGISSTDRGRGRGRGRGFRGAGFYGGYNPYGGFPRGRGRGAYRGRGRANWYTPY